MMYRKRNIQQNISIVYRPKKNYNFETLDISWVMNFTQIYPIFLFFQVLIHHSIVFMDEQKYLIMQ